MFAGGEFVDGLAECVNAGGHSCIAGAKEGDSIFHGSDFAMMKVLGCEERCREPSVVGEIHK